jgi:ligand-binding sensor domain-containing protein
MFFGIIEDSAGNIWWGSLNGINRYNGKSIEGFREVTEMEFKID